MTRNEQLAYIAGFFDGEGSITIHQNGGKAPRGKSPNHMLQVSIGNTNPLVLRWLHEEFGGSYCLRRRPSERHRTCHQWIVRAHEALVFLIAIEPFLKMKKEQCNVALEFQSRKKRQGPKQLSEEEVNWREEQRNLIRRLNGRYSGVGNVPQAHL